jgi:uncharacterized protein
MCMKILISPAKSMNETVTVPDLNFTKYVFQSEAKKVVNKLKKLKKTEVQKLMHVSELIAELNVNRNKAWHTSDELTSVIKPAAYLFSGEVYRGLDFSTLSLENQKSAQEKLRILSGMYGVLKPLDLIHPYRLEMGTSISINSKTTNLYQFWGDKVLKSIENEMNQTEVIVNLASAEYAKVIVRKKLKRRIVTPNFKELKNGELKMIMVFAKQERGAMSRWIIENNISNVEELKNYQLNGYRFDESLSTDSEWLFTR